PDREALARELTVHWGVSVRPAALDALLAPGAGAELVAEVQRVLDPVYRRGVVANRRLFLAQGQRGVWVRDLASRAEGMIQDPGQVADFEQAVAGVAGDGGRDDLARALAAELLRPNLTLNGERTATRRREAGEAVKPVLYQVSRGEMLVREGDRVSPEQGRRLAAHREVTGRGGEWSTHLGLSLLVFAILYSVYRYGTGNIKKFRCRGRDALFLAALMVGTLALERLGFYLLAKLAGAVPADLAPALLFALPLGAAAVVVRVVLNSETAALFVLPFFALAAVPFEHGLTALLVFAVGGLAGAHRAARACHRMDFLRAGACMAAAQAAAALCAVLLEPGLAWQHGLWWPVGAAAGGLLGGLLALGLVPLAEWALGYTTEMRLMELASLDHPLLRQLMLRAPGTYHHSIVTGTLVKAAAEAIGARALLATVAAYYHDIGKTSKPAYFIENQAGDRNRHDKLTPSMSSLILISHLKEGVEQAQQHRLGADIVDIIQQHHGTSLIQFFYDRARQQGGAGSGPVREQDYRYPGPKPQTREAALVLLADAVEAASRTVPDPRPARIRGMVQRIIGRVFADGQLDECDLTLKDLHHIAGSFSRILAGIHHQRIDYPLPAHKERKDHGDLDSQRPAGQGPGRGTAETQDGETLKRLGL
ncbi:MAG: HDIG domain-containing protein, partial [Deferrisomatales bacterium]|nr:HDIG domain-containing protein [Deferrisomatales bacterium]